MRLIDADYFDKMLIDAQAKCAGRSNTFKYGFLSTVRANLERCPSVDAVRVVRCKDCEYSYAEGFGKNERLLCEKHPEIKIADDFYCADGWDVQGW